MSLNKDLIKKLVKVTSRAAINCYQYLGKEDKKLADKAATDSMRNDLNNLEINGEVVIGEGELDEAPMLYIGEKLGKGNGPNLDIAVDPLEGTNFAAKNIPGAISVLAISEKGNLFNAPETYMNKIAVGNDVPFDATDLDYPLKKNIYNIAEAKNKNINELTVCILDRPRHKEIIEELKLLKVKLKLISDGDICGALLVTDSKYNVDLFLGIGGGPEGVISAAALDAYGCKFQGKFIFATDQDKVRAKKMGIVDLDKKYELNEIVKGESIFCATGITTTEIVAGIKKENTKFITETLVTHKKTSIEIIKSEEPIA
ncbi:class II fructose-bisphosphatase [Candidatus Pelagibacter sp.]|nr:class II fructose-bisphosphatase [Candidatus Pelagibacter sp.]